ncbi:uncharacterized protein LOC115884513 [Sitophilus oryzae]|uniref:Uncharacterized protein LOC115884513 n=1 Tax=Sitophilus oryzae TaxID=7048 RepID=A0A6J2Y6Y1_SITOR|nr:uncharacterized protein LOC115884513 [Sitophilus oryzae]
MSYDVYKILVIFATLVGLVTYTDCNVDVLRLQPTPLVVDQNYNIVYHTTPLQRNEKIHICCPGNSVIYNGELMNVECLSLNYLDDDEFEANEKIYLFNDFKCQQIPRHSVKYNKKTCENGGTEIEIGYDLKSIFVVQITVCFDNNNLTPIYSYYNITKTIGYRDGKVPRVSFEENGFYTISTSLDRLYERNAEIKTINTLLSLNINSEKYIKRNGDLFINRGHLAAKGDFVYSFQQLATFQYVNSAPQWASFNGGNWNEVEINIRDYAMSKDVNLEIYTGVYGISTLPNEKNNAPTNLYLFTDNNKNLIPVPLLFWKVAYNRKVKQGVVIVGINNPYITNISEHIICEDIWNKIQWFNSKLSKYRQNVNFGYTYACSVPDFRTVIKECPDIDVHELLQ